jgi:alkylation response protein AidB-like acyl-CoA dehydrogenase
MSADPDLLTGVRDFLEKRLSLSDLSAMLQSGAWDRRFLADFEEFGWSQLGAGVDRDGLGIPLPELGELMMLIGERLAPGPLAEQLLLSALIPLPLSVSGQAMTMAFADPAITVDWREESGSLILRDGRLSGTVGLVRHAPHADYLVLAVDPTVASRAAVILLALPDPAVAVTELASSDPTASYGVVTVTDRPTGTEQLVASDSEAVELLSRLRSWSRIFTAGELAGIASRVLSDSVDYVQQRRQFGRPVGSFQAVKHILADMATRSASLNALVMATLHDAHTASVAELELASWTLKAYAARCGRQVCEDGLQVHGGIGFTEDHHLHWFIRRALALRTWYGDDRELAELIGLHRLGAA